ALALPAEPLPFALVPLTATMEEKEARRLFVAVARIQRRDAVQRNVKHGFILRHLLTGRVRVIAEQREEETLVLIGEVMHFKFFQKLMHGLFVGEDGRNHNKSARIFGNA